MDVGDVETFLEMLEEESFWVDCAGQAITLAKSFAAYDTAAALNPNLPLALQARDGEVLASQNLHLRYRQRASYQLHIGRHGRYRILAPAKGPVRQVARSA